MSAIQIVQMVFTVIFLLWMAFVGYLLWRHALGGGEHINRLHLILNENTKYSVESANEAAKAAQKAAEAALVAVENNQKLVALLEKGEKHGPT